MNKFLKVIILILVICIIGVGGYILYLKVLKNDKITVSFNTGYEVNLSNIEIKNGESINLPTLEREGYNFLGWYINEEQIDSNYKFDKTTILSAKWEKNGVNMKTKSNEFNYNLILNNHEMEEKNKNYLISPYSIEVALNMLRDGASKDTKLEIDKVIGTRKINDITIKDKVMVANSIFIKKVYEENVLPTYRENLKNNYNADIIIDELTSPNKINDWVNEKTKGMIPKILDEVSPNFVLGLLNALAIDVKWQNEFECEDTISEEFTKADGSKINVEMMHKMGYQYIKEENVEGIVLPYKKEEGSNVELEFIGLIPTGNLDNYLNESLEKDIKNLSNIIKTPIDSDVKEQIVNLSLPRFTYDSGITKFKDLLKNMGIQKAFQNNAEFNNMVNNLDVFVSEAIHKTHIELTESGTKAAAVTYFGVDVTSMPATKEKEYINIKFNKPFIYLIREKNTGEMLFFGLVNEPNLWKGSTCSNNTDVNNKTDSSQTNNQTVEKNVSDDRKTRGMFR